MERFKKNLGKVLEATSNRDKILLGLYLLVFIPLGVLMRFGIIPFPGTVTDWVGDIINSTGYYSVYIGIFIAVQITNVVTLIGFVTAEDGFVGLVKRHNRGYYIEDNLLEMAINFSTATIAISVNILMFPMFVPVYIVIGVVLVFANSK